MTFMHFHDQVGCLACRKMRHLRTPVPNNLILYDCCEYCGKEALVGMIERKVCRDCLEDYLNEQFKPSHTSQNT